jgi:hypothetical protein
MKTKDNKPTQTAKPAPKSKAITKAALSKHASVLGKLGGRPPKKNPTHSPNYFITRNY